MTGLTTLDEIKAARNALPGFVRRTPIVPLARNSKEVGREKLFLKCENLQVTGAYKIRAATAVLRSLDGEQRKRGVVVTSSGNFAQAYAYAGAQMDVPIVVVMLDSTSPYKVENTKGYGAEVVFCGSDALHSAAESASLNCMSASEVSILGRNRPRRPAATTAAISSAPQARPKPLLTISGFTRT